jgi:hypothetical protein
MKHIEKLSTAVVSVALVKFILDGITVTLKGSSFDLGHVDAAAYMAILTPVLAAHGFMHGKKDERGVEDDLKK